jgi:ABC-type oligopeptide transport system substrate-binding subunit
MIEIDAEQIRLLERRLSGIGVDRRTLLKIAAAATGSMAAPVLLACGPDTEDAEPTAVIETTATVYDVGEATPTPAEGESGGQVWYDLNLYVNPASHDFNANLYCGGVPSLWSGLGTFDPDLRAVPDWAERWEPNEDATVWTFFLRKDNTGFSNGDPVTAETFRYSWTRMLLPDTGAPYASILYDVKNAEAVNLQGMDPGSLGLRTVDEWTFEVEMEGPRGLFPVIASYLACVPCHPPSVETNPTNWTDPGALGHPVVCNGPFYLTEWEHDVRLVALKNPNHWNAANVKINRLVVPIIPPEQGLLPYENDEMDYTIVPGADLERVREDPQLSNELVRYVFPGIWYLTPQVSIAPFDDPQVRRAVSQAIDRQRLMELVDGQGQAATGLMPPGIFGHFDDEEIVGIQRFDPAAAIEHLAGTPYEGGTNWPEITLSLRREPYDSLTMAEDIAAQLQENLNMNVAIAVMEPQDFLRSLWDHTLQLVFIRWFFDYPDPNNGYFDIFYSGRETGSRQAWGSQEYDALTIEAKEEVNPERRLALYRQCEMILQEEVAYIPATYFVFHYLFKPWCQGLPVNSDGFVVPNGNIFVRMHSYVYVEGRPESS